MQNENYWRWTIMPALDNINVLHQMHKWKKTNYCKWNCINCGHWLRLSIHYHPRWPQLSQSLCKMDTTTANRETQTLSWILEDFLQRHSQEAEELLQWTVTGDRQAHHYKPNSNWQSMEWKYPTCPNTNRNCNLKPLQAKWCCSCLGL